MGDVPMSSRPITSARVCTSPILLKPTRKPVDYENEMTSKSNTSKSLNPAIENHKRLGSACKQGAARVGNVKKSTLVPSESEHLERDSVSSLDQPCAMPTASKSRQTRGKGFLRNLKETSAKCEKEKHDTFKMSEKIETAAHSRQRDSEEVSPEGLDSLPVNTIASTLTKSDLEKIATEYDIDTNRYHLSIPESSERANSYFQSKNTFCIYAEAFKAGLRLPLHPLIPEILTEFGVAPTQITPNSWRVLFSFISLCCSQNVTPTVNIFREIYYLNYRSGECKGWWYFYRRVKLFENFPQSKKVWKERFFKIQTSERDALGFNTTWGLPKSEANQHPTLSDTEANALKQLLVAVTNKPADVSFLLSKKASIQARISSKPMGFENELQQQQRHSLSRSSLVKNGLQRKRAATESEKSALSGLSCQEPILIDVDQEDLPERKRLKESLQPMEQTPPELAKQPQQEDSSNYEATDTLVDVHVEDEEIDTDDNDGEGGSKVGFHGFLVASKHKRHLERIYEKEGEFWHAFRFKAEEFVSTGLECLGKILMIADAPWSDISNVELQKLLAYIDDLTDSGLKLECLASCSAKVKTILNIPEKRASVMTRLDEIRKEVNLLHQEEVDLHKQLDIIDHPYRPASSLLDNIIE